MSFLSRSFKLKKICICILMTTANNYMMPTKRKLIVPVCYKIFEVITRLNYNITMKVNNINAESDIKQLLKILFQNEISHFCCLSKRSADTMYE